MKYFLQDCQSCFWVCFLISWLFTTHFTTRMDGCDIWASAHSLLCAKSWVRQSYRNTSPIRHRSIRWITPFKYKNVSLIRHHAPKSNAFPGSQICTVKVWYFPLLFVQSPNFNTYLKMRYSRKCWLLRFTYRAPHTL